MAIALALSLSLDAAKSQSFFASYYFFFLPSLSDCLLLCSSSYSLDALLLYR